MTQVNNSIKHIFNTARTLTSAITFDEVTFEDKPSLIHPNDVNLTTQITTKYKLKSAGIMSAAMDTVTEKELALALAKLGSLGIIHRNMDIEEQCQMVKWVRNKIHYGGMIEKPICYKATDTVSNIETDTKANGWTFTNFPIIDDNNCLIGMVSRNELEFIESGNPLLSDIMMSFDKIITTTEINKDLAYKIMREHKVKKLPVIDKSRKFVGLYAWNDIRKDHSTKELFSLDEDGHFLVGAAVGSTEIEKSRITKLAEANCKIIVIDTSHGANKQVIDMLAWIKTSYPEIQVIIGNIASYSSALYILSQQVLPDAIKVGISAGSICTTRRVTGHGMPQLTAIYEVWRALAYTDNTNIPIIADGGIRYAGDIVKAFAVGASSVMLGNIFAGCDESAGKTVILNNTKFKTIRGMGSTSAMQERSGSRQRYFNTVGEQQKDLTNKQKSKLVPEGIEGLTITRGSVENIIYELTGGIRSGLAHSGADTIIAFRENCTMWTQTMAGIAEGNPHSLEKIESR